MNLLPKQNNAVYYLKDKPSEEMIKLFSLPEGVVLTEEQQVKIDTAITILEEDINNTQSLIAVAQVKYQVRDFEGAIYAYLKALEIQPTNVLILNNLGDIYNQQKEYSLAAEMYLRIIESTPKWTNAYRELASIYFYHLPEKYSQMEDILLTGLERSKEFGGEGWLDFYSMLAVFYDQTDQTEKAIEYYQKVIELAPQNQEVKVRLEELKNL